MEATLIALLLGMVTQSDARACSCGPRPEVPDAYAQASAVFAGRCISGKLIKKHDKDLGDLDRCQFTFVVTHTWKGVTEKTRVTVETGTGSADCGYNFEIGSSYILYCYRVAGTLGTNICTRTRAAEPGPETEKEIAELDETVKTKAR